MRSLWTTPHLVHRAVLTLDNLLPACWSCNVDKGARSLSEYLAVIARRQPARVAMRAVSFDRFGRFVGPARGLPHYVVAGMRW